MLGWLQADAWLAASRRWAGCKQTLAGCRELNPHAHPRCRVMGNGYEYLHRESLPLMLAEEDEFVESANSSNIRAEEPLGDRLRAFRAALGRRLLDGIEAGEVGGAAGWLAGLRPRAAFVGAVWTVVAREAKGHHDQSVATRPRKCLAHPVCVSHSCTMLPRSTGARGCSMLCLEPRWACAPPSHLML